MAPGFCFCYNSYSNSLLFDFDNNELTGSSLRVFFKSNDSLYTLLISSHTLTLWLIPIPNTQVNRYINKNFERVIKLALEFFFQYQKYA